MPEKSICTKCVDGWMVKVGNRLVCSHCGEEEPLVRVACNRVKVSK